MKTSWSIFSQCLTLSGPSIFVSCSTFCSRVTSGAAPLRNSNASMNFLRPTSCAHSFASAFMRTNILSVISVGAAAGREEAAATAAAAGGAAKTAG